MAKKRKDEIFNCPRVDISEDEQFIKDITTGKEGNYKSKLDYSTPKLQERRKWIEIKKRITIFVNKKVRYND